MTEVTSLLSLLEEFNFRLGRRDVCVWSLNLRVIIDRLVLVLGSDRRLPPILVFVSFDEDG